ncbi:alpha/beta fold hydrolase [Dyella humicola]|uniref:alpha/beta fold hydrolase n=1 Tax=Dyella humicola TaxID=2992126 RepID=UPI002258982A|nr:alpha/beta hydrolase [Dyella humicola]
MNAKAVTVVFAHGAWADESSWSKVVSLLRAKSIKTVTVSLPFTSLPDDVAAVDKALDGIDGTVVLVGHAYAGAVIQSTQSKKVKGLVFVAGLAPDEGETVAEIFNRFGHGGEAPELAPSDDGLIRLPASAFKTAFAQHATAAEQTHLAAVQRPISPACIVVPVGTPLWKSVPSWFLIAQQDHMIPEETQRFMAQRMNAHARAFPVDHLPSVTAASLVTDIVEDAIQGVSG